MNFSPCDSLVPLLKNANHHKNTSFKSDGVKRILNLYSETFHADCPLHIKYTFLLSKFLIFATIT